MKWNWKSVDAGRVKRASQTKLKSLSAIGDDTSAEFVGSTGEIYHATLDRCTCEDFARGNVPCKHILRVGMEAGLINRDGLTPSAQRKADILALKERIASAAGWYYVFQTPIISDAEYDSLRARLKAMPDVPPETLTLDEFAQEYCKKR